MNFDTEPYKFSAANEKKLEELRLRLAAKPNPRRTMFQSPSTRSSSPMDTCQLERPDHEDVLLLRATQFTQAEPGGRLQASQESQEPMEEEHVQEEEESLDISLVVANLREALSNLDSISGNAVSPDTLASFVALNPTKLGLVIDALHLDQLSGPALMSLCKTLRTLEKQLSLGWCTAFANHCFLPRVCSLKHAATRDLTSSVNLMAKIFPRAVVEGFMMPCVAIDSVDIFQCEIICGLFKDSLTTEHQYLFIQKFHQSRKTLNESLVSFLQTVLDCKFAVDDAILDIIITWLVNSASILASNLKFAKLVLNCVREFGAQMSEKQCIDLNIVIAANKTALKRPCEAALKAILAKNA